MCSESFFQNSIINLFNITIGMREPLGKIPTYLLRMENKLMYVAN